MNETDRQKKVQSQRKKKKIQRERKEKDQRGSLLKAQQAKEEAEAGA